jgi:hypothetical protein
LNLADHYLWGPLRDRIYVDNTHSLEQLKRDSVFDMKLTIAEDSSCIARREIYAEGAKSD